MLKDKRQIEKFENRNNYKLYMALLFLCVYGLIMIYSITALECGASEKYEFNSFYFVQKQAKYMLSGFGCIFILQFFNYRCLRPLAPVIYLLSLICIALLKTSRGVSVNGATRWLDIGVQFQVSELVKLGCIIISAWIIKKYRSRWTPVKLTIAVWILGLIPVGMLFVLSKDFSSSMVVLGIFFIISFVCIRTIKMHLLAVAGGCALAGMWIYGIWTNMPTTQELEGMSFRVARIASWLDPDRYPAASYQWYQGIYAISRGGFLGKGLGNSLQKNIIPEAHNDFIFSILVEEMGFVGGSLLIFLFVYLLYQIICVALSTKDIFGKAMLVGIFAHIGVQTIFNLGVTLGVLPNTGLPLPFISYGGTAVFILLGAEMAIVFSVERSLWRRQIFARVGRTVRKKA